MRRGRDTACSSSWPVHDSAPRSYRPSSHGCVDMVAWRQRRARLLRGGPAMSELPTGTVTFLFSDIEGSTRLLQRLGARYADMPADHQRQLRAAWREHAGIEYGTQD